MRYYFLLLAALMIVCVGCTLDGQQLVDTGEYVAPPPHMLVERGPMVGGPGPGVIPTHVPAPRPFQSKTTQIRFVGPAGMSIGWQVGDTYADNQLTAPARYNFAQGATYRLKLTNIPGREGLVLYPSLQVYPAHPTTDAYLAHNSIPLELTDEDLDQVESNNFVTKVIYLPDPKFQELAIAGVETLVSTRLDPGVDPIAEADRRGTIMVVLRMGNMDLEMPDGVQPPSSAAAGDSQIRQTAHQVIDGATGQHVPPTPVAIGGTAGQSGVNGVPGPMMMASPGGPGLPAYNPISGVPGGPMWGIPVTSTPIGLPGPPHLPLGTPAGLRSHTVRNLSKNRLPAPVDHMLIDVKHEPGLRMPKPVKHVQYTEKHPLYRGRDLSTPNWAAPR
ncbi:MAG: hypothetical protein D6725_12695 [Planctomycetota bacterium]|nr:MAG: hypothetical protein D6725_12695 [Planctomycetota bacterium]